jgi:predicted translin family RNA/ssDNA-binding protein
MIDRQAFSRMRAELAEYDQLREQLIKRSRDILKDSKAAIYALHRNNAAEAASLLGNARNAISECEGLLQQDPHLGAVGAYHEALEEYTEAACYHGVLIEKKLPTPAELKVDTETYLPGLCDLVGELTRKAINSVIDGDAKTALELRDLARALFEELLLFNFGNSPVRRKFDSIKYSIEKLDEMALKLKLR